jgi:hypothetical protein
MPRLFLCWIAFLTTASWVGILTAELDRFSTVAALSAGAAAALLVALVLRRSPLADRRAIIVPALAFALIPTILPVIDTTLLSQDASIHRASGQWLARNGSLGIPDRALERLTEDQRFALFGSGSVTSWRVSLVRLPGGIVLPDIDESVSHASFSHLLAVWIAIAEGIGGDTGTAALGPLLAFTAWWAIGLVAFVDAGWLAALAALSLIASWLPEHWFARFLMPEILAQALVWSGVAAARLATPRWFEAAPGRPAAVLAGLCLGVAAFARLEQFGIFVPSLLLARALLPARVHLLPRGALLPFLLVVVHAGAHLLLVPTDYANRAVKLVAVAWWNIVVWISSLSGHDGYVTIFVVRYVVVPGVVLGGLVWLVWTLRRNRRAPGFAMRANAAFFAALWLALLYSRGLPDSFPAVRALFWYVPWPLWGAIAMGVSALASLPALDLALAIEALDQLVSARVTAEQIWASRRLVTIVLPLIALVAARAVAGPPGKAAGWRTQVARFCVVVSVGLGILGLAPTAGRSLQAGGAELADRVAAAIPDDSLVVVAKPLDWTHVAASLWLDHGKTTLVVREHPDFAASLTALLDHDSRRHFALSGAVVEAGDEVDPALLQPIMPDGYAAREIGRFDQELEMLEATQDRVPRERLLRRAMLVLYELERVDSPKGLG